MRRLAADSFDRERLRLEGDWALCFVADWCSFCRAFVPTFEQLDGSVPFSVALADVTDLESPLWDRFHVEVVPTLLAFREGREFWRRDGTHGVGLGPLDLEATRNAFRTGEVLPAEGRTPASPPSR